MLHQLTGSFATDSPDETTATRPFKPSIAATYSSFHSMSSGSGTAITTYSSTRCGRGWHPNLQAGSASCMPPRVLGTRSKECWRRTDSCIGQLATWNGRQTSSNWACRIFRRRQSGTIIDWVELVSDDELQMRPLLATAKAWSRLVIGDLDGVERWLDVAEGAVRDSWPLIPWADTDHLRDLARARDKEMQALPATIAIYRASIAQARGDVEGRCPMRGRAELADPDDHLSRGGAAGFLGLAAWAAGDLPRRRGDLSARRSRSFASVGISPMRSVRASFWPICRLLLVAPVTRAGCMSGP